MAFGIMYGFVCGCFLSLSPAVAAQLYGSGRLAGLSGLLLLFNLPGMCLDLIPTCAILTTSVYHLSTHTGNSAGAPLGGAILSATGGNWVAVSVYSGSMQIFGGLVLLYGRLRSLSLHSLSCALTSALRSPVQA